MRSLFNQRIVEVGIVVAFLLLIGVIVASNQIKARKESRKSSCINNLRMIECTKLQWALEQRAKATGVPTEKELWAGFWRGYPKFNEAEMPACPDDPANSFKTSYQIRSVVELPICLIDSKNHVLPQHEANRDYIQDAWLIVDAVAPSNNPNSSSGPVSNRPSGDQ
jgi:hypothetical protein